MMHYINYINTLGILHRLKLKIQLDVIGLDANNNALKKDNIYRQICQRNRSVVNTQHFCCFHTTVATWSKTCRMVNVVNETRLKYVDY